MRVSVIILVLMLPMISFARGGGYGGGHSGGHSSSSRTHVHSYTKKDGTHVDGHDRTKANDTKRDNWSTKGNTNPDTGKAGTKDP